MLLLTVVIACCLLGWSFLKQKEEVTTTRLSPGEKWRAILVELRGFMQIDRNFRIRLEDRRNPGSSGIPCKIIFSSPDEGGPPGTERFLWSRDGEHLLLVGKHFLTVDNTCLTTGESLYFLYDVSRGEARCNAAQQSTLKPFSVSDIAGIDFGEKLRLEGATGNTSSVEDDFYFIKRGPEAIYAEYKRTKEPRTRDQCIHLLFVIARYHDGEFDVPVDMLLEIAENNPRQFFKCAAEEIPADTYTQWVGKVPAACFTDFPGDRDLKQMEARRLRLCKKLRSLGLEVPRQEARRDELLKELKTTKVRRVE